MKKGWCYLVGTGPGDPGLVTLRAWELVRGADVIVYDYLASEQLVGSARPDAEKIYVGKKAAQHTLRQESINELLVRLAREGKSVVRLKGGDPFVFGRGGEEAEELRQAGVPFEVVPGVTSGVAAPAYAGIPVTHRDATSCLTLVTGHEDPTKEVSSLRWRALVETGATLAIYMGVDRLAAICGELTEAGMSPDGPVALVQWGTLPRQKTVAGTLANIVDRVADAGLTAPAIIVVGKVVDKRKQLAWFDQRPLFGRRIVVTRTREQAGRLSQLLVEEGADVIELPTLEIAPVSLGDDSEKAKLLQQVWDWMVFTSPNAVRHFLEPFCAMNDLRALGPVRLAAIGNGTAQALKEFHLRVDYVAVRSTAFDLAQEVPVKKGDKVLFPCGNLAGNDLENVLRGRGCDVTRLEVYRTEPSKVGEAKLNALDGGAGWDWIIFTSASAAENFHKLRPTLPSGLSVATLGPITTAAVRALGWAVRLESPTAELSVLVKALIKEESRCDRP